MSVGFAFTPSCHKTAMNFVHKIDTFTGYGYRYQSYNYGKVPR